MDGFSKKMEKLLLSAEDDIADACNFMLSEKKKVSGLLEILEDERVQLHERTMRQEEINPIYDIF
ncbi:MAG: hypothetical protein ACN4E2_05130 [Nitrospinota bacterium]